MRIEGFELQGETFLNALAKFNSETELSVSVELMLKEKVSDPNIEYRRLNSLIEGGPARNVIDRVCALAVGTYGCVTRIQSMCIQRAG
jgi:hypothetical protein